MKGLFAECCLVAELQVGPLAVGGEKFWNCHSQQLGQWPAQHTAETAVGCGVTRDMNLALPELLGDMEFPYSEVNQELSLPWHSEGYPAQMGSDC